MFKLYLIIHVSTTQHSTQTEEKAIFTREVIIHIHRPRTSAYFYLERKKERRTENKWQMRSLWVHVSGFPFVMFRFSIWLFAFLNRLKSIWTHFVYFQLLILLLHFQFDFALAGAASFSQIHRLFQSKYFTKKSIIIHTHHISIIIMY